MIRSERKTAKAASVLCLMLSAGIFMVCGSGCRNDLKEVHALTSASEGQEDIAYNVEIIYSEDARVTARIRATEFARNEFADPPYTDFRKGVEVHFFNDSGVIDNTLLAKYARIYEKQNNILIRDSVVVFNRKGERLETSELIWNQKIKKFYTDHPVEITTSNQVILGEGMEANQDFSWYTIHNIKGTLEVEDAL